VPKSEGLIQDQVSNLDVSGFALNDPSERFSVSLEMEMGQHADEKKRVATRADSE